jgi:F0F1-type ATP synthase assembly protein I
MKWPFDLRRSKRSRFSRSQRMTIATGILCIIVTIIVLQLWLFTASMNAYLGGDTAILLPAAIVSLVCLGLNAGLLYYLYGLD